MISPCLIEIEPGIWQCRVTGLRMVTTSKSITCICDTVAPRINKPLPEFFDRVVVLSMKKRSDRLEGMYADFKAKGWPFMEPIVFDGIDGSKVPKPTGWTDGDGAWGCMEGHRQILERAIQDGVETLLVLEDDCRLIDGFTEKIEAFLKQVPANWDQLMLGGQHMARPYPVKSGVVRCQNTQRTHAYAVRGRFMRALYQHWISTQGHCDQRMGDIQKDYKVYAPDPFLCAQAASPSDISGRWGPTKFWSAEPEPSGPLCRTQFLIFELGQECNFGDKHKKCPNKSPLRFALLNTDSELDDDTIVQCAVDAYQKHGFGGMIGWHYYNEPTLQGDRMLKLMEAIRSKTTEARFVLWTNNSRPDWVQRHRRLFAMIHRSNYAGDPDGNQLDDRLDKHTGAKPESNRVTKGCLRPFTEFILDHHGNHHPCCFDWQGRASLGNVFVDGFAALVERWEKFQEQVCLSPMSVEAPEQCRTCGQNASCGHKQPMTNFDWDSARRAEIWLKSKQAERTPADAHARLKTTFKGV